MHHCAPLTPFATYGAEAASGRRFLDVSEENRLQTPLPYLFSREYGWRRVGATRSAHRLNVPTKTNRAPMASAKKPDPVLRSNRVPIRDKPSRRFRLLLGLTLGAAVYWGTSQATRADAGSPTPAPTLAAEEGLSLKGKTIGITVIGTDHYWDLRAYQGQIDEVKRLGGTPIALDGGRDDKRQISQIQTLVAQKPDVIIEQLGTLSVLEPWLEKVVKAGIPLFTVDTASAVSINDTT